MRIRSLQSANDLADLQRCRPTVVTLHAISMVLLLQVRRTVRDRASSTALTRTSREPARVFNRALCRLPAESDV